MANISYGAEEVTRALMQIVVDGGNVRRARENLIRDGLEIPESTLRVWKDDRHREQYRRIEEDHGRDLERQIVAVTQANVTRAAELEAKLIEDMADVPREQKPQALRALVDAKSKGTNQILALTGRSQPPARVNEFGQLLDILEAKGLVKMNVPRPAETVDGTADELPAG
jgi:hypothetical protein